MRLPVFSDSTVFGAFHMTSDWNMGLNYCEQQYALANAQVDDTATSVLLRELLAATTPSPWHPHSKDGRAAIYA